jgi:hypothetical protein
LNFARCFRYAESGEKWHETRVAADAGGTDGLRMQVAATELAAREGAWAMYRA